MAPRKLSDSDKQQITQIYCQPGETTSTLATQFGVSSSTVSRVLKQVLSENDYASLMQWKRGGERGELVLAWGTSPAKEIEALSENEQEQTTEENTVAVSALDDQKAKPTTNESDSAAEAPKSRKRRSRRRSTNSAEDENTSEQDSGQLPLDLTESSLDNSLEQVPEIEKESSSVEQPTKTDEASQSAVVAWAAEDLEETNDYDEEDESDDWGDEDWDDDPVEEDNDTPALSHQEVLSILSFDDFALRKPCYLVVDRLAELITCPLKEFSELGLIPAEEEQARTLPVFDNHRVARRFARRNQRIIKVPTGSLLSKTQDYLQAKGITRVLFDGQVYALN